MLNISCNPADSEPEGFRDFLKDAGASALLDHLRETVTAVLKGHNLLERDERARHLKLDIGTSDAKAAAALLDTARRHAALAESLMRAWAKSDAVDRAQAEGLDGPESSAIRERLADAREHMARALLATDIPAEQAKERMQMFDMALERVLNDGLGSALSYAADQIAELSWCLTEAEDWGRKPHSPIPWWMWAIIIGLILAGIALVVICFIVSACAWMTLIIGVAVAIL